MIRAAFLNCLVVIAEYLCHKRDKDLGADNEGGGAGEAARGSEGSSKLRHKRLQPHHEQKSNMYRCTRYEIEKDAQ